MHSKTASIWSGQLREVVSCLCLSAICACNAHEPGGKGLSPRQLPEPPTHLAIPEWQTGGATASGNNSPPLPAPPEGVSDLKFAELFVGPVGPRGLAFSPRAKELEGKRVRMAGYRVEQEHPVPGQFLLCQTPMVLHEEEYGFCEDLPPTIVHVLVGDHPDARPFPHGSGLWVLTGTLSLGNREEPDGRISAIRLRLDPSDGESKPETPVSLPAASPADPVKPELSVHNQTKEQKEKIR